MQGSSPKGKSRSSSKASQKKPSGPDKAERDFLQARDQEKSAAWTAIRMATLVALAQRVRTVLIGDPALTSLPFKASLKESLPDFALQDLLSAQSGMNIFILFLLTFSKAVVFYMFGHLASLNLSAGLKLKDLPKFSSIFHLSSLFVPVHPDLRHIFFSICEGEDNL